jgi:hypothetical protein
MLRTRVRGRTNTTTNADTSLSHGLGVTLDFWHIQDVSSRGRRRNYVVIAANNPGINRICIRNAINSQCTVDVVCFARQGRLY